MRRSARGPERLARDLAGHARRLREALERQPGREMEPMRRLLVGHGGEALGDAFAQTVAYGLLAARWMGRGEPGPFTRETAVVGLPSTGGVLAGLLEAGDAAGLAGIIDEIITLLAATPVEEVFRGHPDPAIHFYQDFLGAYDPAMRRRMGVYYTPDEVVSYIVAALDERARARLGLRLGLADPIRWGEHAKARGIEKPPGARDDDFVVQILDPATGTGTFLVRVVEQIAAIMTREYASRGLSEEQAARAWTNYVREALLPRLYGFEGMAAPYLVAHLRVGLALERGARGDEQCAFRFGDGDRLRIFLTNTLARGDGDAEVERIKREVPVLVVLGNPPYERVSAGADEAADWMLKGRAPGQRSLFDDITEPAREHTIFSHHACLYDRYVYFWRWALWRVFEQAPGPGLVGLVTNGSWLRGPGFVGLRALVRRLAGEVWTIDLGGDNRGAAVEANVFGVETPIAITTVVRTGSSSGPARSYYRRLAGATGGDKLRGLAALLDDPMGDDDGWRSSPNASMAPLAPPTGSARWRRMPALADLMPWQQPGCMYSRLWPIAPAPEVLAERWRRFVGAPISERPDLYQTPRHGRSVFTRVGDLPRLADLSAGAPAPEVVRYGWRSFDRQWALADPRLAKTESPSLWASQSSRQIFLAAMISKRTSAGPQMTVSAHVPDKDFFCGRGGKDVLPLYRDAEARQPNVTGGLLEHLGEALALPQPSPEDLAAYVYAVLSAVRFQERFAEALATPGPRVPITGEPGLWRRAVSLGRRLLWLHTFGERLGGPGATLPVSLVWERPPTGAPETMRGISYDAPTGVLTVGDGWIAGVSPQVWGYSVSGMPVVRKWLGYRTARGAGRAARSSNPLDRVRPDRWRAEWREELLELLSVLTLTMELQAEQGALLDAICEGSQISGDALPRPTPEQRRVSAPCGRSG